MSLRDPRAQKSQSQLHLVLDEDWADAELRQDLYQTTDSLRSSSRLQLLLHPGLGTGLSGSLAWLLAREDKPVSRKLAGNSCRFIKQGESPGMADHESESNQGCLLSELSFLARSRADGTGCLCMLNDSPSQLFRERQLSRPSFWKSCLFSLPHIG